MKKNDTFELTIEDVSVNGEGVGHFEGLTFFVKDTVPGDQILASVTKLKKTYGFARMAELLEGSKDRVKPRCPIAGKCGGCQIQQLDYASQLKLKQALVRNDLIRIGGFDPSDVDGWMEPIVGMESPWEFRNKAQIPVGIDRDGNPILGFYGPHSHRIVPHTHCYLGRSVNDRVEEAVLDYMREYQVPAYNEENGKGLLRHVLVRVGFTSGQVMVCMIVNGKQLPHEQELVEALCRIEGMTSITLNENTRRDNVILGDGLRTLWGSDTIEDSIGKVHFSIGPKSFYQVNPEQTEKLYGLALEYAGLTGQETVWDLYCGIGTISLFLAQKARQVYGVEIVPEAIKDAEDNARLNRITNAKFFVGKAEEVLPDFYEKARQQSRIDGLREGGAEAADMLHPDVIVVDPPRKGCDPICLDTMLEMAPERIVYVSCDPATLSRDLKILCAGNYEIKRVRPVDQFGHSMHVETCVLLTKTGIDTGKVLRG